MSPKILQSHRRHRKQAMWRSGSTPKLSRPSCAQEDLRPNAALRHPYDTILRSNSDPIWTQSRGTLAQGNRRNAKNCSTSPAERRRHLGPAANCRGVIGTERCRRGGHFKGSVARVECIHPLWCQTSTSFRRAIPTAAQRTRRWDHNVKRLIAFPSNVPMHGAEDKHRCTRRESNPPG
jgi:hypothetical protein